MSKLDDPQDDCPRSGMRLLIVDRDDVARQRLRAALEPRFEVTEAAGAPEALRALASRWFNVVLADQDLGEQRGVEFLEQLAQSHPHVRRILMSELAVPNVRGLREAGVFQLFMAKPVDPQVFAAYFRRAKVE